MKPLDEIMKHLRVIAGTQSLAQAQMEARQAIKLIEKEANA